MDFSNRRLFTRATSDGRFLVDGPEPIPGRLKDLSYGGARVLLRGEPRAGDVLDLLPPGDGSGCRLKLEWCRPFCKGWREAGGRFQGGVGEILGSWVGEPIAQLDFHHGLILERRGWVRFELNEQVEVLGQDWVMLARAIDLSLGGARVVSDDLWPDAERVQLALGDPPEMLWSRVVSAPYPNGEGWRYSLCFEGDAEEERVIEFLRRRL